MKKIAALALLCGVFLTACASRATYHEEVPPTTKAESKSSEPTEEIPVPTVEAAEPTFAASTEAPANIAETTEPDYSTEDAHTTQAERGNPGLEPGTAFEFNGTEYIFELPVCLAVMSQDGRIIEWRGEDIHSLDIVTHLQDVSDNAILNEFESGKWYFSADGRLLNFRQVTQEEYDSMTGFGLDCPPENEYLLEYGIEDIYNVLFYAPYAD